MREHWAELRIDAIVLAGGSARRMGGVDKPALTVGGTSLVQKAVDAVSMSRRVVVVGPHRGDLATHIAQTRESPSGTGPVAAISAGLSALPDAAADIVLILAADLPFVDIPAVETLLSELTSNDAAFAVDRNGREQFLFGAWRGDTLRQRIAALSDPAGLAVRSIIPDDYVVIEIDGLEDCDTPEDLARARESAAASLPETPIPTAEQARELVRRRIDPLEPRKILPAAALGCTLSDAIIAAEPLPPVDISAMDGYAVRGVGPWTVREDVAYAGTSSHVELAPGDAMRIATGAAVPTGASSVVRDEHVARAGDVLSLRDDAPARDDTRRAGADWKAGTELVPLGTSVSAAVVSVALSAEVAELAVRGPVRALLVVSGNEIQQHGPLEPGHTRDSIGAVLPNYLACCGATVDRTEHLRDSPTAFADLLARTADVDVVVIVGATGHGAADQLRSALVRAGADIVVQRTHVRPGGSQITAVLPSGTIVLGLPGNPLAAVATTMLITPAIVDALTARRTPPPLFGQLTPDSYLDSPVGRIVPVQRDGMMWRVHSNVHTAHLLNLVDHDALALIPPNVTPGAPVELLPLPR